MNGDIAGRKPSRADARPGAGKTALDAAIAAHYNDLRGAVRRRGLGPGLATEVVHDLYIQLSDKPAGHAERSAGTWKGFLIRAAINLGIDRLRRRTFERRLFTALDSAADEQPGEHIPMERRIDAARRLDRMLGVISSLPRQCRNVFIAYHLTDRSKDEVGEGLGMKRRMVDRHLRKALLYCMEHLPDEPAEIISGPGLHADQPPPTDTAIAYGVAAE